MTTTATKNNETRPAKVQTHRGGRQEGAKNFSKDEIRALILAMKEIVPSEQGEWERVAETHIKKWPGRDCASIRRKCKALLKKARFERSPHCSWETRMLRKIHSAIVYKRIHCTTPKIKDEEPSCISTTAGQEGQRPQGPEKCNMLRSCHIKTKGGENGEAIPSKIFLPVPSMEEEECERQLSRYYSKAETRDLLLSMRDILPVKRYEWEHLAQRHAQKWPGRDLKSIRRKYNVLCKKQPWKHSNKSWEVRMASYVMNGILDKEGYGDTPQFYKKVKAIWSAQAPDDGSEGDEIIPMVYKKVRAMWSAKAQDGCSEGHDIIAMEENEIISVVSDSSLSECEDMDIDGEFLGKLIGASFVLGVNLLQFFL